MNNHSLPSHQGQYLQIYDVGAWVAVSLQRFLVARLCIRMHFCPGTHLDVHDGRCRSRVASNKPPSAITQWLKMLAWQLNKWQPTLAAKKGGGWARLTFGVGRSACIWLRYSAHPWVTGVDDGRGEGLGSC